MISRALTRGAPPRQESMEEYLRRALPADAAQWVIAEIERLRANQRTGRIIHGDAE